jgi:peptidoglycan hydrolase-like protein with peptidoglycan-binding domain
MAAAMATTPAAADAAFGDRVLREGDRGREVRVLQRWLTLTGFATSVDGHFGRRTRIAVRRYERAHGLRVNGWVSRQQAQGLRTRAYAARAAGAGSALISGCVEQISLISPDLGSPCEELER